jgi:lysophospholipase L1-like esterase
MADPSPRTRRGGTRQKLLLAGAASLVGLLVLEGAVRVRHFLKHGSFTPIYDFVVDEASGLSIPRPGDHGRIVCDSRGFRSPELVQPKPAGLLRIAFVGGSTTFCAEASGNATTWPAQVFGALRAAHPRQAFDWLNAAAAGYATDSTRINLEHRVLPLEPDLVVVYHGTNDLTKDTRALAAEQGLWSEDDGVDWLERHSMLWEILKKNVALRDRGEGPAATGRQLEVDMDELARGFERRLEDLVRDCEAAGALVALVTFSHRVRAGQGPAERREACQSALYYMPFLSPDQILAGITAYNEAVRRVAARTGAILVDGEERIPADGVHFNDSVHLLDAGCRVQAQRVGEALLQSPRFTALLKS